MSHVVAMVARDYGKFARKKGKLEFSFFFCGSEHERGEIWAFQECHFRSGFLVNVENT